MSRPFEGKALQFLLRTEKHPLDAGFRHGNSVNCGGGSEAVVDLSPEFPSIRRICELNRTIQDAFFHQQRF